MTSENLAILENESLVVLTEKLNAIDTPHARLLKTWAKLQCSGDQPTASKIYQTGVAYIHAAVDNHQLNLPVEYLLDGKVAIVNPIQITEDNRRSIDIVIAEYIKSKNIVREMFSDPPFMTKLEHLRKKFVDFFYPDEDSQAMLDLLSNPTMVFFKWDNEELERPVFGGLMGMPEGSYAPLFDYAKIKEHPLSIYISEKEKNSGPLYAKKVAGLAGLSESKVWSYILQHENVHSLLTEPLFKLLLQDPAVTWISEAIAVLYGDVELYSGKLFESQINRDLPTEEVISASSKTGVNYYASLEVWISMSIIKTGSNKLDWKSIKQGSIELITGLIDYALNDHHDWLSSQVPLKLLGDNSLEQIDQIRPSVRNLLRSGIVAS